MFNLFKNNAGKPAADIIADIKGAAIPTTPANHGDEAHYTIGVNEEGNTQFRVKTDGGFVTLTMTDQGVLDLIEDLAHPIRKRYVVGIKELIQVQEK